MAAFLTLTVLFSLSSCGNNNEPKDTTSAPTTEATIKTEHDYLSDIPVSDFKQYEFHILSPSRTWAITAMTAEEISGDIINDAIAQRQQEIEQRLNIKLIEKTTTDNITNILMINATAGVDDCDLALVQTYNALSLYQQNYLIDQTTLDAINLENPWWESSFNADVNIGSKRYLTFGQANLIYYCSFYMYAFNKDMIARYGLENPYDLVKNNEWTWDKMYQMMQTAATDTNGDGIYTPGTDILGLAGHINHSRNLILSSGQTITHVNADGYPEYTGLSEKYIDAFSKFTDYFITSPISAIAGRSPNPYDGYNNASSIANYLSVFNTGGALFLTTGSNEINACRESETEYGIVVVPKYESSQDKYITPVYSATEGFVIPSSAKDPERTALILETLGAISYNNIVDKHIKTVLHYRCANDPVAVEMIDLAYASGAVDKAMANNFGTCTNILNNLNTYGSKNISSTFTTIEKKLKADIEAAIADMK